LYLPSGQGWYNLYDGTYQNGGQRITVDAPYERTPVFVKEGSIIPYGPELQYTSEKPADTITLYVYTGKDATFNLYEDENINYNYEKGAFSNVPINYNEAAKQITIGAKKGNFPGMLTERTFNIVWVEKNTAKSLDFNKTDATITYKGGQISIKR
jgi:alpha-D-xyloside xylohydrolase